MRDRRPIEQNRAKKVGDLVGGGLSLIPSVYRNIGQIIRNFKNSAWSNTTLKKKGIIPNTPPHLYYKIRQHTPTRDPFCYFLSLCFLNLELYLLIAI